MARLRIRVHPRAARDAIRVTGDDVVAVWTTAPPVRGQANAAVCRLLATWLEVPPSSVRIVTGGPSRTKLVDVGTQTDEELRRRLQESRCRSR